MEFMATSTTSAAHSNLNDENTDGQSYEIKNWDYKDEDEPEAEEEQEAREKEAMYFGPAAMPMPSSTKTWLSITRKGKTILSAGQRSWPRKVNGS